MAERRLSLQRVALVAIIVVALVAVWVQLRSGDAPSSSSRSNGASQSGSQSASQGARPGSGTIAVSDLPAAARDTIARIKRGGPFPEREDGTVFQNREGRLPSQPGGYYHEFTVRTPGESDRGPRRIVSASDGTLYWTADHYRTFRQVTGATGSRS